MVVGVQGWMLGCGEGFRVTQRAARSSGGAPLELTLKLHRCLFELSQGRRLFQWGDTLELILLFRRGFSLELQCGGVSHGLAGAPPAALDAAWHPLAASGHLPHS